MLLVRQAFQGAILTGPETADRRILRLFAGRPGGLDRAAARRHPPARQGAAARRPVLLTATIVKVFLVDAGELEGLLRILSFLGLGIALIGIGRLYGPVLRAEAGRRGAA